MKPIFNLTIVPPSLAKLLFILANKNIFFTIFFKDFNLQLWYLKCKISCFLKVKLHDSITHLAAWLYIEFIDLYLLNTILTFINLFGHEHFRKFKSHRSNWSWYQWAKFRMVSFPLNHHENRLNFTVMLFEKDITFIFQVVWSG